MSSTGENRFGQRRPGDLPPEVTDEVDLICGHTDLAHHTMEAELAELDAQYPADPADDDTLRRTVPWPSTRAAGTSSMASRWARSTFAHPVTGEVKMLEGGGGSAAGYLDAVSGVFELAVLSGIRPLVEFRS